MSLTHLVTGAAGFIGSHLVDRLLAQGHRVVGLDNEATGRRENLAAALANPAFAYHRVDVAEPDRLAGLFDGVDRVYHLAGLADIVPSIQAPLDYHHANIQGTFCVLEAARLAGVKRFVYAASSSCYGIAETVPTPETAPIRPMYPYALTKYMGELAVEHWSRTYGLPAVSLRLFNVFGPRSRTSGAYGAVFGVFLAQKLQNKPLTVVGDGKQTRDFTFVSDVVRAFDLAGASSLSGVALNVGSGGTYPVNLLVSLLGGGPVVHLPKRPGEPDVTFADTAKIERMLGWKAEVPFADGVAVMLEHIEDWRTAPLWDTASIAEATRDWFACLKDK